MQNVKVWAEGGTREIPAKYPPTIRKQRGKLLLSKGTAASQMKFRNLIIKVDVPTYASAHTEVPCTTREQRPDQTWELSTLSQTVDLIPPRVSSVSLGYLCLGNLCGAGHGALSYTRPWDSSGEEWQDQREDHQEVN